MAPSSNPAQRKSVVPAIPLPLIQKKERQQAARAKAQREAAKAKAEAEAQAEALVAASRMQTPPPTVPTPEESAPEEVTPAIVDGSSDQHSGVEGDITSEEAEQVESTTTVSDSEPKVGAEVEIEAVVVDDQINEQTEVSGRGESTEEDHETAETALSMPSDPPSSAALSTFHMPPPFVPASKMQAPLIDSINEPPPGLYNGQQGINGIHHGHPSNGSIMFGYPESNNSSPAPPASAGNTNGSLYIPHEQQYAPQHASHPSNGSHSQQLPNGYSPMGPPPPGYGYPRDGFTNNGPPGLENYGPRQQPSYAPSDVYNPVIASGYDQRFAAYNPSTPHSIHGSQASAHNEQDNTGFNPATGMSNGNTAHMADPRLYQQSRPTPPPYHSYMPPPPPFAGNVDSQDSLLYHLISALNGGQFADYVLELRYPNDTGSPQIINGHSLIFARSPLLRSMIENETRARNCLDESNHSITRLGESNGMTERRLLLVVEDRFLRSDSFAMALKSLYGAPLLDVTNAPTKNEDRFDFALGYAAAGHILKLDSTVFNRGIEVASLLLDWYNFEKALDFAIDGGLDTQWDTDNLRLNVTKRSSTYPPGVNMLIYRTLNFMIQNFPSNFVLDVSVGEPMHNRRLPIVPEDRRLNPRLSQIKFGDHSDINANPLFASFSRVLINMPYHLLKYVLESPELPRERHVDNTQRLLKLMTSVIAEREKRRTKVMSSPDVPDSIKEEYHGHTLRFTETVDRDHNTGIPRITRFDPNQ